MKAVIVAHGVAAAGDRDIASSADLLIAADGGALICAGWGLQPQIVVGDLDSLGAERAQQLGRTGTQVLAYAADKDESDTELAMWRALDAGATDIVLLAALGGERLDHELANLLLLAHPRLAGRACLVRGGTTVRAVVAGPPLVLRGAPGDLVTLLPLAEAQGVVTKGLRYLLDGEPLRAGSTRGLSNVVATAGASVSVAAGQLLVIESARDDPGVA